MRRIVTIDKKGKKKLVNVPSWDNIYVNNQLGQPAYDVGISSNGSGSVAVTPSGPNLVMNLDAANYLSVPLNGSTIAGTGGYTVTISNANSSMAWNSVNNGVFRKSTTNSADRFIFGPDYTSVTQPYTVGMVYKWDGINAGRLLNANSVSPDWLLGLWDSPASRMNIAYTDGSNFIGSSGTAADTNWHFIWLTWNGTNSLKSYIATTTQPTTTNGTAVVATGFNQLRLFGRYSTPTTSVEVVTADVGFVKIWDDALTLAQIQTEYSTYATRFGY
jgi:hypothetical protein